MNENNEILDPFTQDLLNANLIHAKTFKELEERSKKITSHLTVFLATHNTIKNTFDFDHLKAIHRYLFKNIYDFAGKDRFEMGLNGMFSKGNTFFTHSSEISQTAKNLFGQLKKDKFLVGLNTNDFAHKGAIFFGELNSLHPFREGNGRTQRLFMKSLALNAGYNLDLKDVPPMEMISACNLATFGKMNRMEKMLLLRLEKIEDITDRKVEKELKTDAKIDLKKEEDKELKEDTKPQIRRNR